MHIVLGLLTSIITILYLLDRMGIDLGGMNPFYWRRRRAWAAKYESDPIYSVEEPMHVAALLIVGAAKLEGELTAEQKKVVLQLFESKFSLDSEESSELLGSAAHLLGSPQVIDKQLNGLAEKNKDAFSKDQTASMIDMIVQFASADGELTAKQSEYVESIRSQFVPREEKQDAWR